jgi:hypothetical protein
MNPEDQATCELYVSASERPSFEYFSDRIYRIDLIFLFSQLPKESENIQSDFAGRKKIFVKFK